ncbi:hypothetical protein QYE76_069187 [Lolium multiflorum]|uniref:Uncharacterized protein n=1 Tax=Lolium multiflorum TaxID=4521 RepID=A0AAD8SFU2_LOLMU|nr:hypothetical protein QYE76_023345 [Lolium multiflorum]KAK1651382.1 hypothetical protein QYE76_069187 [Lolium multiflorum]
MPPPLPLARRRPRPPITHLAEHRTAGNAQHHIASTSALASMLLAGRSGSVRWQCRLLAGSTVSSPRQRRLLIGGSVSACWQLHPLPRSSRHLNPSRLKNNG